MNTIEQSLAECLPWKNKIVEKKSPIKLISKLEMMMAVETAKGVVVGKIGTKYPAPLAALSSISRNAFLARQEASKVEIEGFIDIAKRRKKLKLQLFYQSI